MAGEFQLNSEQLAKLKDLTDNGEKNFAAGYDYLRGIMQDHVASQGTQDGADTEALNRTIYWLEKAAEINRNDPNSQANVYIRNDTDNGFSFDGVEPTLNQLQKNSDAIGKAVITDTLAKGHVPGIQQLISKDVGGAIGEGGQTLAGWGGSFYFWDMLMSDKAGDTVGNRIQKDAAEYEKFLAVNTKAVIDTISKLGISVEQFWTGMDAQAPDEVKAEIARRVQDYLDGSQTDFMGDPDTIDGYRASIGLDGKVSWYKMVDGKRVDVTDTALVDGLNTRRDIRIEKGDNHPWQAPNTDIQEIKSDDGTVYRHTYGQDGRVQKSEISRPDGTVSSKTYNSDEKVASETVKTPDGSSTVTGYDPATGKPLKIERFGTDGKLEESRVYNGDGTSKSQTFDADGKVSSETSYDAEGRKTGEIFFKTDGSRTELVIDPVTGTVLSRKDFDAAGNVTRDSVEELKKAQAEQGEANSQLAAATATEAAALQELATAQAELDQASQAKTAHEQQIAAIEAEKAQFVQVSSVAVGDPAFDYSRIPAGMALDEYMALSYFENTQKLNEYDARIATARGGLQPFVDALAAAQQRLNEKKANADAANLAKAQAEQGSSAAGSSLTEIQNRDLREGLGGGGSLQTPEEAAAQKAEAERLAAEKAAAEKAAAEEAARLAEEQRLANEQAAAAQKAEAERLAAQQAAELLQVQEAQKLEAERLAKEQAAAQAAIDAAAADENARKAAEAEAARVAQMQAELQAQLDQQKRQMEELVARQQAATADAAAATQRLLEQNRQIAEQLAAQRERDRQAAIKRQKQLDALAEAQKKHRDTVGAPSGPVPGTTTSPPLPTTGIPVPMPRPVIPIPGTKPGGGGISPVVLDMDGNGAIDLVALPETGSGGNAEAGDKAAPSTGPRFDWNGDGIADATAWVGPKDGLLAIDLAADGQAGPDGKIDQPREVAFALWKTEEERQAENAAKGIDDTGRPITDLEGLRHAFDSNLDNILDSRDARWKEFRIWQDMNQNGISEAGELQTLEQAGIRSIDLLPSLDGAKAFADGSAITGTSAAQKTDGTSMLVGDVTLSFRPSSTTI